MKPLQLLSMLPRRPLEFYDRASAVAATRWEALRGRRVSYTANSLPEALRGISGAVHSDCLKWLSEPDLALIQKEVEAGKSALSLDGPFPLFHNGDSSLGRVCYAATRAVRPKVVIETGVCYGVTSAHVLQALEANQEGHLQSIDLPPLGKDADKHVGRLIPGNLRRRWTLHRGVSGRILPSLLQQIGCLDLFIHDSLHTFGNMKMEFSLAWPALRPGGLLIADDVEGNPAFLQLMARRDVALSFVVKEEVKDSFLGIAVKG